MKKYYILSAFLFFTAAIYPQDKSDFQWVMGYNPNDSAGGFGGTIIQFNTGVSVYNFFNIPLDLTNSAQICDDEGYPLFYTNGCSIINRVHQQIENGDDLSPGYFHDYWCNTGDNHAYSTHQGLLALPWPGHAGEYYLFHMGWFRLDTSPYTMYLQDLYSTRIDMNANGGLGRALDKNHRLLYDTNLVANISAVRHGNGRDWWVVAPRGLSDNIYVFLLSPEGIQGPYVRHVGAPTTQSGFLAGQIVFSPDGNTFVRVSAADGIDIMGFDRCSGQFNCAQKLPFPYSGEDLVASGAAVSPNSRFLYISTTAEMYQYDLWSADIEQSKVLLGEYDGFKGDQLWTTFYQQMLAPDGKIYMTATNGVRYLHVINSPDLPGVACDFRQHGVKLPTHHGYCVPNFPHFRLYDAPGSPCDTLGIDAPEAFGAPWASPQTTAMYVRPNPANDLFTVTFPHCQGGYLRVFTIAGQALTNLEVGRQVEHVFDCSAWPAGMYVVSFTPAGACKPFSAKLVVAR